MSIKENVLSLICGDEPIRSACGMNGRWFLRSKLKFTT